MKWAVAGLVLFVLAAMLFGPVGEAPPFRPERPRERSETVVAPPVIPPPVVSPDGSPTGSEEPEAAMESEAAPDPADRLVRLLIAGTGERVANLGFVVVTWDERRHGVSGLRRTEDGYLVLPRYGIDTGKHRIVEIGQAGYARKKVDLSQLPPRSDIALVRIDDNAHGSVALPPGKLERGIQVTVRSPGQDRVLPEYAVLVLHWRGNEKVNSGPLMLYDLPDGDWILEFTAVVDGAVVSAKKQITVHGGTAELGTIDLTPWAGIRARVVDADGKVVPQAVVSMCREEEDETKARTGETDRDGWASFRDFEPGRWHRVTAGGLPGPLSKLVLAPEKRGEVTSVDLEWPDRLVPCDLAFDIVPGAGETLERLDGPVTVTPVFATSPAGARFLLLPAEYTWTATLSKGEEIRTVNAKLIVPAGDHYEGVVRFR